MIFSGFMLNHVGLWIIFKFWKNLYPSSFAISLIWTCTENAYVWRPISYLTTMEADNSTAESRQAREKNEMNAVQSLVQWRRIKVFQKFKKNSQANVIRHQRWKYYPSWLGNNDFMADLESKEKIFEKNKNATVVFKSPISPDWR